MSLWLLELHGLFVAISGVPAPSAEAVKRAMGHRGPHAQTLRRWRKGLAIPGREDVVNLLECADIATPGFSEENEENIRDTWWMATKPETSCRCACGKPATKVEGEHGFTKCNKCYHVDAP